MSEKVKISYTDDNVNKRIFGFIISEDTYFYTIEADGSGTQFKIGKAAIISIKYLNGGR